MHLSIIIPVLLAIGILTIRYVWFKPATCQVTKLEKVDAGWRAEVSVLYRGKTYPQVWVSDLGVSWHNIETGQEASWGFYAGGDEVAFAIACAKDAYDSRMFVETFKVPC